MRHAGVLGLGGLVLALFLALGVATCIGERAGERSAELTRLRAEDATKLREYEAKTAALTRQLAAAAASVDSANARYRRSDALRRRLVLVAAVHGERPATGQPADSVHNVASPTDTAARDTVAVDPRVLELVAAQDSTIDAQRRAIARQALALSTATGALAVSDALLANRARQIAVLERMLPSRFWRNVERVVLVGGGLYLGWKAGTAASR